MWRPSKEQRSNIRQTVSLLILGFTLIWTIFPIFWAGVTSLKPRAELTTYPPKFFNFAPQWHNYIDIFTELNFWAFIRNGLIAASGSTLIALFLGLPHSYAVSRFENKWGNISLYGVIAARMIPPVTIAVPFYLIFNRIGLVDTKIGITLILTFLFEPYVVWVMKGFFDSIPEEIEECARVDGASKLQSFTRIMLPLAGPGLGSATIIAWIMGWNEFILVFILSFSEQSQTVPIGVLSFMMDQYTPWNWMMAAAIVGIVPTLIILLIFQRFLVRGLAEGALKQ